MKLLHLYLSFALLAAAGLSARADSLFPRSRARGIFSPVTSVQTIFRAQSGDVPLPSDPGTGGSRSIVPDGTTSNATVPSVPVPGPSSAVDGTPTLNQAAPATTFGTPTFPDSTWNAFSPPISPDPFAVGPSGGNPYVPYTPYGAGAGGPFGRTFGGAPASQPFSTFGANGPAPFRQGWHNRLDIEWMPETRASGVTGNIEQFGVDYDLGYSGSFLPGWVMTWTNQFRLRNWDGPTSGPGLPGKAFRFGWDFELESAQPGPVNIKLGLTPSINSDLNSPIGSAAFQLDGRGMFIFQLDQYWSLVLGAGYWDRVNDRVIPYAGFVYRDDFWEWRVMYPETTISLFLGNEPNWSKWMYFRAEHHIEAYDVSTAGGGNDQVELEDWRATLGFRMDGGMYSWFIEGGWVFEREVDYGLASNGRFNPNTGFITRMGWRY